MNISIPLERLKLVDNMSAEEMIKILNETYGITINPKRFGEVVSMLLTGQFNKYPVLAYKLVNLLFTTGYAQNHTLDKEEIVKGLFVNKIPSYYLNTAVFVREFKDCDIFQGVELLDDYLIILDIPYGYYENFKYFAGDIYRCSDIYTIINKVKIFEKFLNNSYLEIDSEVFISIKNSLGVVEDELGYELMIYPKDDDSAKKLFAIYKFLDEGRVRPRIMHDVYNSNKLREIDKIVMLEKANTDTNSIYTKLIRDLMFTTRIFDVI